MGLELERIVNKALAKDPDERYQGAVDLLVDLRTLKKERESSVSRVDHRSHVTQAQVSEAGPTAGPVSARITEPVAPGARPAAAQPRPFFHRGWVKFAGLGLALLAVFVAARWVPPLWEGPMGRRGPGGGPPLGWRGRGAPPRIIPITSDAGTESFASFSPDASQIAYTWDGDTTPPR